MSYEQGVIVSDNVFRDLEDESHFLEFVGGFFRQSPEEMKPLVDYTVEVDDARLSYAHAAYVQGVERFSILLQSGDPDHYKRAGALLHGLYQAKPITSAIASPELEAVDTLCTDLGVTYAQSEAQMALAQLYEEYHNELTAFALAYGCCRQYEENEPPELTLDYLRTVCVYLKNNGNLSVESLFMLFKSLMFAG